MADKKKSDKEQQLEQDLAALTADLQRVQADFVNYRARMEDDRQRTIDTAKAATIMKLLPVVDNIERATHHVPSELIDNQWAKGITGLAKGLESSLASMGVVRILAVGQPFDPNLHEAVSAEGEGDHELVSEELRAGYKLGNQVIRPSMVKVIHQEMAEAEPAQTAAEIIQDTKATESSVTPEQEARGED